MEPHPKLGTRGSPLALAQARKVASALEVAQRWESGHIEIVAIKTKADKVQDRPLAEIGGKALWTKELDAALLEGRTDFSVHSMKDVESERPKSIRIAAVRPRGDFRERLIGAKSLDALKKGAVVGTSSPRRKAQLLAVRPDLKVVPLRGNVDTRLKKVEDGEVDATLLTAAGLRRLGMTNVGTPIAPEVMLPAPGQGVLGMECRTDDGMTARMLGTVTDEATYHALRAERAFVQALGATCHSPVAALALLEGGRLWLRAELLAEDGSTKVSGEVRLACGETKPARELARKLLKDAPEEIRKLFSPA